jgi:hypothetical protein
MKFILLEIKKLKILKYKTAPYPGFQQIYKHKYGFMCKANKKSILKKIFLKIDLCMLQN